VEEKRGRAEEASEVVAASVALQRQSAKIQALQAELNGITKQYGALQRTPAEHSTDYQPGGSGGNIAGNKGVSRAARDDGDSPKLLSGALVGRRANADRREDRREDKREDSGEERNSDSREGRRGDKREQSSADIGRPGSRAEDKDTDIGKPPDRPLILAKEKTAGESDLLIIAAFDHTFRGTAPHLARQRELAFIEQTKLDLMRSPSHLDNEEPEEELRSHHAADEFDVH
jgi:hypothetical protein